MPLIDLKTNLKSLKFGNDRPGGGSSNQPYIKSKIPDQDSGRSSILSTGGPDSLIRGGILSPIRAAEDASRLTQLFFDFKSPIGLLFTAKQNLLSRVSVSTEASKKGIGYGAGKVNQGIYTPLSTIGQTIGQIAGLHLNTFGIDPSSPMTGVIEGGLFSSAGLTRYEKKVKELNKEKDQNKSENRLLKLTNDNFQTGNVGGVGRSSRINFTVPLSKKAKTTIIDEYGGGPGSILGIGKTRINYTDQRTGLQNNRATTDPDYFYNGSISQIKTSLKDIYKSPLGKTNYGDLLEQTILDPENIGEDLQAGDITWNNIKAENVYESEIITDPKNKDKKIIQRSLKTKFNKDINYWNGTTVQDQQNISKKTKKNLFRATNKITDFRDDLSKNEIKKVLGKLENGYKGNIQMKDRVLSGDPGSTIGKDGKPRNVTKYGASYTGVALDKITASDILPNRSTPDHGTYNDLCKFSIGVMNNNANGTSNYMHFRAFIDGFSDSYTADWGDTQYVGRADKFYNYKGFGRSIDLSFTVAAQSKAELMPMYKKLNYLASSLAPSYSQGGFMQGNLVRLTMGGYLYNQVGILKSITYTIPQETPWEIAISDGENDNQNFDSTVRELPHMIKVTGFNFIPIQDFVPKVGTNSSFIALK